MSDRDTFLTVLLTGPLYRGDVVVVLCGEDGDARTDFAIQLFRQDAAPYVLLSGALHDPPHLIGAEACADKLVGAGMAPSRVLLDLESTNTREQAVHVVARAVSMEWTRLLLVASAYHLPRAYLTFVKALQEAGKDRDILLVPVPVSHVGWWHGPPGNQRSRFLLAEIEQEKVGQYAGHVASYADGLEYLRFWEDRLLRRDNDAP